MTPTTTPAQPEELRIADAIDPFTRHSAPDHLTHKVAADHLRRLHAQVAALTAAQPEELERLRGRVSRIGLDIDRALRGKVNEQSPVGVGRLQAIAALAAPAQPAAPQGGAYAGFPPSNRYGDISEGGIVVGNTRLYTPEQMRDFADRTHALRASHGQAAAEADWWRKRADEIEAQVAATGSQEAMRCYTDMRTLLQAATAQPAPAAHVQNPAEIEHVAGDVSKNGAKSNVSAQQTPPAGAALSDAEIDRIVPALEPVSEDFPAEWAVWKDRERIREELRASRGQAPATQQEAQEPAEVPRFNCWSTNEGDSWFDHPADSQAIYDCLGNDAKVGDEYELTAGWKSVTARYRITEVVGDGEEYEVECISHPQGNTAPQPSPTPQADSQPAPQGETNAQLDTDSNSSAPGQQRDVAGTVALGQPVGHGSDSTAGDPSAQGDKLLTVAERNIRSFLRSATFKSESDREAALNCVDVLWAAARTPADSVTAPAGATYALPEASPATKGQCNDERACGACFSGQGACEVSTTAQPVSTPSAQAADSVLEDAALSSEQQRAIFEAYESAASESYFEARPQIDCSDRRRVFKAGYERGWDAARKQGGA